MRHDKKMMDAHMARLRALGIERHALELDVYGYTIVPPEVTGLTPARCDRLAQLLLDRTEVMTGVRCTLADGPLAAMAWPADPRTGKIQYSKAAPASAAGDGLGPSQFLVQQLYRVAREFRDLGVHPAVVTLIEHMIGPGVTRFSASSVMLKWKGPRVTNLNMHVDQGGLPLPWGRNALTANTNWCLTDYTLDNGPLAMVPGSHHRHANASLDAEREAVPVECPRGSCIVFHGQTWHGAYPKRTDGLRVMVTNYYRHMHVQPQEDIQNSFPRDLADDCCDPARFKRLAGFGGPGLGGRFNPKPYQRQKKGTEEGSALPRPRL